jgi:two-component system cell cycle sensor histidine kinase/response regulator CckA
VSRKKNYGNTESADGKNLSQDFIDDPSTQKALDCVKEGIIIFGDNFVVRYVNNAACLIIGCDREEVLDRNITDIFETPEGKKLFKDICEDEIKGESCRHEMNVTGNDGQIRTILGSGTPILDEEGNFITGILFFIDITDRKRSEIELERLKSFNESLLENITSGVLALDNNLDIIFANKAFSNIMNKPKDEITGKYISDVLPSQLLCKNRLILNIFDILDNGGTRSLDKFRLPGDNELIVNIKIRGFEENEASGASILLIINDLTAFYNLSEQLERSRRMESIGRLAGGIAHDFNNILGSIMGYASLLQTSANEGSELYVYLDKILESAERAAEQTNQLLAMAIEEKDSSTVFDPIQMVEDVKRLLSRTLDRKYIIQTHIDPATRKVRGTEDKLQQCLMDICLNSRDAMPDGGTLKISTENVHLDREFCSDNIEASPGDYVLITITDNGTGIHPEIFNRIFEPFFTTKEPGDGSGLSLSAAYATVKNMGGFIQADSVPMKSTSFRIYIPATSDYSVAELHHLIHQVKGGTESILVVEDNLAMSSTINEILQTAGYRTQSVDNGREAVAIFSKEKDHIDLIVLDLDIPDMGGWETFEKMRSINRNIPVIFSTGYSRRFISSNILKEDITDYLQKPFRMSDLLGKVRSLLDTGKFHRFQGA